MNTVHCIVCDTPLQEEERFGEEDFKKWGIVYDGLVLKAAGNFGSTVYDPLDDRGNQHLELYICDVCLIKKAKNIKHIHIEHEIIDKSVISTFAEIRKGEAQNGQHPTTSTEGTSSV